ncbi:MAG TPA: class I SAM-dependent methyltransferase, partial [Candidatus Krumholzibacterium sp.]|nr:class I SAM-dependent methyltransferase [Candidatus Krumholzibacterium sp.]
MEDIRVINDRTRRAYDLAGPRYHELFRDEMKEKEYDRLLLDRFAGGLGRGASVLDAGCGPSAHIGRYIFDKGFEVTGLDISGVCVAIARGCNPGMEIVQGDIGEMPFAAGAFDAVVSYYSIIDTPRAYMGRLFGEFRRVLRPGGRLLVAVKAGGTEGYMPDLLGTGAEVYFTLFSQEEIEGYFNDHGF